MADGGSSSHGPSTLPPPTNTCATESDNEPQKRQLTPIFMTQTQDFNEKTSNGQHVAWSFPGSDGAPSSATVVKTRAEARENVASSWASYRAAAGSVGGGGGGRTTKRKGSARVSSSSSTNSVSVNGTGAVKVQDREVASLSPIRTQKDGICRTINREFRSLVGVLKGEAWTEGKTGRRRRDQPFPLDEGGGRRVLTDARDERGARASDQSRAALSERVERLHCAAAVHEEVEALSLRQQRSRREELDEEEAMVSFLPAGFDTPLSALPSLSGKRSRAYLLLDLASIITAHRLFVSYTVGTAAALRVRRGEMTRLLARGKGRVYIQPEFRVCLNRDNELLKLLIRLGVGLRCGCGDDVEACTEALREELVSSGANGKDEEKRQEERLLLVDDAGKTRKPDGYLRRLVRVDSMDGGALVGDIAVDGPEEVRRISASMKRFEARRTRTAENASGSANRGATTEQFRERGFILRLPPASLERDGPNIHIWLDLVQRTHDAALDEEAVLTGVSVDLTHWSTALGKEDSPRERDANERTASSLSPNEVLHSICNQLRQIRTLLTRLGRTSMRIDLTSLPYPLSREHAGTLTTVLATELSGSGPMNLATKKAGSASVTDKERREMEEDGLLCSVQYTADVSHHLVAHAGALCTRIIGVRRGGKAGGGGVDAGNESEGRPSPVNNDHELECQPHLSENDTNEGTTTHYYIDDGCYGSLSSNGKGNSNKSVACPSFGGTGCPSKPSSMVFNPVPLYGTTTAWSASSTSPTTFHDKSSSPTTTSSSPLSTPSQMVNTTVWGPTCDGLDQVCESVLLPGDLNANRDWLVFPHLGCGGFGGGLGLGTAFNGFDPPDSVYCVLGYFSGGNGGVEGKLG